MLSAKNGGVPAILPRENELRDEDDIAILTIAYESMTQINILYTRGACERPTHVYIVTSGCSISPISPPSFGVGTEKKNFGENCVLDVVPGFIYLAKFTVYT